MGVDFDLWVYAPKNGDLFGCEAASRSDFLDSDSQYQWQRAGGRTVFSNLGRDSRRIVCWLCADQARNLVAGWPGD
jgi:hypothetical protein